jgi:Domain of unknown function (DUF5666)
VSKLFKQLSSIGKGLGLAALLGGCGGADPVLPGGNGGGVGSGGTGIHASGVAIGPISGFGSIVVNDVVYEIDTAALQVEDTGGVLKLGATVRVEATVSEDGTTGTATEVQSAAELRGNITALDTTEGYFLLMGTKVSVSAATVFDGFTDIKSVIHGHSVQVHGLPYGPGLLRATRIEKVNPNALPIVSGFVQGLNTQSKTFQIGELTIDYNGLVPPAGLANGDTLRVRAEKAPVNGVLKATAANGWYKKPMADGVPFNLSGVVANFDSPAQFSVLGSTVNAANAKFKGGTAQDLGNGVRITAKGVTENGVLVASNVEIKQKPGGAETLNFTLSGPVVDFFSDASFTVKGQFVDASSPAVVFAKGTRADLKKAAKVKVTGTRFDNSVLLAERVEFR